MTRMMAPACTPSPKVECNDAERCVTNTTPIVAYRGAGRPEATAADRAGHRPVRGRDRHGPGRGAPHEPASPRTTCPYTTPSGTTYDIGDYERRPRPGRSTPPATTSCGPSRPRGARPATRSSSASACRCTSRSPAARRRPASTPRSRCSPTVRPTVYTGTSPHGQGHAHGVGDDRERASTGIPMERIEVVHGDTDLVPSGGGTMGSRSLQLGGAAVQQASSELVDEGPRSRGRSCSRPTPTTSCSTRPRACSTSPARRPSAEDVGRASRSPRTSRATRSTVAAVLHRAERRPSRSAPTSRWSRSTPRPGRSSCCATSPCDDAGRILNPMLARGPDPRRHRAGRGPGAARGGPLRRGRQPDHGELRRLRVPVGRRAALASRWSTWRRRHR